QTAVGAERNSALQCAKIGRTAVKPKAEFAGGIDMLTRRRFLERVATAAGAAGVMSAGRAWPAAGQHPAVPSQIKAFCIDFNWVKGKFAPPGHWAEAS